jgi:hypothetical protein
MLIKLETYLKKKVCQSKEVQPNKLAEEVGTVIVRHLRRGKKLNPEAPPKASPLEFLDLTF